MRARCRAWWARNRFVRVAAPAAALCAALAAVALATLAFGQGSGNVRLHHAVMAGGGGRSWSAAAGLAGTFGQHAVGLSTGSGRRLVGGFWPPFAKAATTSPTNVHATPSATPTATRSSTTPATTTPASPTPTTTPVARQWVVNTTGDTDDGNCDAEHCSLREALGAANLTSGPDTIRFGIPPGSASCDASGVCTLRVGTVLPLIDDDGTTVDGFSQPGARPNTAPFGQPINAVQKIVLDGSALPRCCPDGLGLTSDDNVIRGLVIQHFYTGIQLRESNGNRLEGNFVGTDASGRMAAGNGCAGIEVSGSEGGPGSSDNLVGGSSPAARNLVAANGCVGIELGASGGNRVLGNYVGTAGDGSSPLPNAGDGIYIFNASPANRVGGAGMDEPNLVAFNGRHGVEVNADAGPARRNTLTRNRIHSNVERGIALVGGGNDDLAAPVITSARSTQVAGTACARCIVEVFSDAIDEGAVFEGSTVADAAGGWALVVPGGLTGAFITSTGTDESGNTSAFSAPVALNAEGPTPSPTRSPSVSPTPSPRPTLPPGATASPTSAPSATTGGPTPTRTPLPSATAGRTATPVLTPVPLWRIYLPLTLQAWLMGEP